MNIISTKFHGILDYTISVIMILTPWMLGFANSNIESWLLVVLGCSSLIYSLCTNYELGVLTELDVRTHLTLDFLLGVLLTLSPWLFGFHDVVYIPYLILGIIEIASTVITQLNTSAYNHEPFISKTIQIRI